MTVHQFRILERMYDPSDFEELARLMRDDTIKQTASRLRVEATRIIRNRTWRWLLMHPDLQDTYINPERSVFRHRCS